MLTEEDTRKYFSRVGFAFFLFGIISLLSANLLTIAIEYISSFFSLTLTGSGPYQGTMINLISTVAIYVIALPFTLSALAPLPKVKPIRESLGFGNLLRGFCIMVLLMSIGSYISNVLVTLISSMRGSALENPVQTLTEAGNVWITLIFVVFLGPILEELVFRKMLCDKLLPLGEGYATLISAAIFGIIHGNFYQIPYAFLLGCFFAYIYIKTGKLIYSTVYHIIINFFGSVLVPWIVGQIDLEHLEEILSSGVLDPADPIITPMLLLMLYEFAVTVLSVVGLVLLYRMYKKRAISFETGILPPPKNGRIGNIFLTTGAAAFIAYAAIDLVLSLL